MNVAVVGTGYVGLVTGTCLAEIGNRVTCVDIDQSKVEMLRRGGVPIYEPQLDTLIERNVREDRLRFTADLAEAVKDAQVLFFALPTPPSGDGTADLSFVLKAATDLGPLIKDYLVVVNKSTVPVGTATKVREAIVSEVEFDVVSNPEFLREGLAVKDCLHPNRIVIGSGSDRATRLMAQLYAPFTQEGAPLLVMDEASAELTKYAANALLATKISFMNEMSNIAETMGADVDAIRRGIGTDPRIGPQFLFPGPGYGGSCFPKDVQALHQSSAQHGYDFQILGAVDAVNHRQRLRLVTKAKAYFGADIRGKRIALWGLAFKPDTDDIREAPALYVIEDLLQAGAHVTAFDPVAMPNVKKALGDKIDYAEDAYAAAEGADALLIVTDWSEFKMPDFTRLAGVMGRPVIFDGRNLYELDHMKALDFHYDSLGRPLINERPYTHE